LLSHKLSDLTEIIKVSLVVLPMDTSDEEEYTPAIQRKFSRNLSVSTQFDGAFVTLIDGL